MERLLLLLLQLSLPYPVYCDTVISELITSDTQLRSDNSPYLAPEGIKVAEGINLVIEGGVVIKVGPEKTIDIRGNLVLQGHSSNRVTMTNNSTRELSHHWGGLRYFQSSASTEVTYLNIEHAGLREDDNMTVVGHSLFANGTALKNISDVAVYNSAGYGLFLQSVHGKLSIQNVNVTGCSLDAIFVSSISETAILENLHLEGNRNGLVIKREEPPAVNNTDICSITCIRCEHSQSDFPMRFIFFTPEYQSLTCAKTFSTEAGNVLVFRPIRATYYIHITIRDGPNTNSDIIFEGRLATNQHSQPMPSIITSGNSATLSIAVGSYRSDQYYEFELLSGSKDSLGVTVETITTINNTESGILFDEILMPVTVAKLNALQNNVGLHVRSSASYMSFEEIYASENRYHGIYLEEAEGAYSVLASNLSCNAITGLYFGYSKACADYEAVAERFVTSILMRYSSIMSSDDTGFSVSTSCRVNISLMDNTLKSNFKAFSASLRYHRNVDVCYITLYNNSFSLAQSTSVSITGYSSVNLNIQDNMFHNNKGQCINFVIDGGNSRHAYYYMIANSFENNQSPLSLVHIECPRNKDSESEYILLNNSFHGNIVSATHRYLFLTLKYMNAILYVESGTRSVIKGNIFINADSVYQLIAGDQDIAVQHDARFNYWGTDDINAISKLIYGLHRYYGLAQVLFTPFLVPDEHGAYIESLEELKYADFQQGNVIGSFVSNDEVLLNSHSFYRVESDIIILPDSTLTINPGVALLFESQYGIFVFGKLVINGESNAQVTLDALQDTMENVRLVEGQSEREGYVEILLSNEWHPLCYSSMTQDTLDLLCAEAGLGDYESYRFRRRTLSNVTRISAIMCRNELASCTVKFTANDCNPNYYLFLTCSKRYWSGIHLAIDARPSVIKHTVINYYGATFKTEYSGILIDFLDHELDSLSLNNSKNNRDARGIHIYRSNAYKNTLMTGLVINKVLRNGIISRDSRFMVGQSNIISTEYNGYGVYVEENIMTTINRLSAIDDKIFHICSASTHVLAEEDVLFLRAADYTMAYLSNCTSVISTSSDHVVALQLVQGRVPECGVQTVMLYDGNDTNSVAQSIWDGSNGMFWVSTGFIARVMMHKHYSYRRGCIDIIFRAWVIRNDVSRSSQQFSVENTEVSGFNTGMQLRIIHIPIFIRGSQFRSMGNKAIEIYQCTKTAQITSNVFDNTGYSALTIRNHEGYVELSNNTFRNQKLGLDIFYGRYAHENALHIDIKQCLFVRNQLSLQTTRYSYRETTSYPPHSAVISIGESTFKFNEEISKIYFGSYNSKGEVLLHFYNNTISHCVKGIVFVGSRNYHVFRWNIIGNLFQSSGSGTLLELGGYGNITDNIFTNSSNNGGYLVSVLQFASICQTYVERNTFLDNDHVYGLLTILSDCKIVHVSRNEFKDNSGILNSTVSLFMYKDHRSMEVSDIKANNNLFWQNAPVDPCFQTCALLIGGYRDVVISENVFVNPELTNEVRLTQKTLSNRLMFEMPNNYWGSRNPVTISKRISDGSNSESWIPLIRPTPFYLSSDKSLLRNMDVSEIARFMKSPLIIGGRLHFSTTLQGSKEYSIASDVFIPNGIQLRVMSGAVLKLLPGVGIYVDGELHLSGTERAPITIGTLGPIRDNASCGELPMRLIGGAQNHEGILEVHENNQWRRVCVHGWTWNNAHVACRQLGFGLATQYYGRYHSMDNYPYAFTCAGKEANINYCLRSAIDGRCNSRHSGLYVVCGDWYPSHVIHFKSRTQQSTIKHVVFESLSLIQVSGAPPVVENVQILNTEKGLVYVGAGISSEKDIEIKNVSIIQTRTNAISLLGITSNVTIEGGLLTNVTQNAVIIIPFFASSDTTIQDMQLLSSFRFCDTEPSMYIAPGEDFNFYSTDAAFHERCKRVFVSDESYSVQLFIKATTTSRSLLPLADIYEGRTTSLEKRIGRFSADTNGQNFTVQSFENVMTIQLLRGEQEVTYAHVTSVPRKAPYCTFENGMCAWCNYNHVLSVEWRNWTIYETASETSNLFKGLEYDISFPNGKVGHYIYVGDDSGRDCGYRETATVSSREAILQGPELEQSLNVCFVTFYHYRSITSYFRDDSLKLYANDGTKLILLWSSSALNQYGQWLFQRVTLTSISAHRFSLLFHARFVSGCRNSVGIDDIKFHQCTKEKLVSTIALKDVKIQYASGHPIWIRNEDPEKHNVVWLERLSIRDSIDSEVSIPAIGLRLKSAYALLRSLDLANNNGRAIDVAFDSETIEREAEVAITQNTIWSGSKEGAIYIYNSGHRKANVWLISNDIRHNSAHDVYSVVQVVNTSLIMESNILYNNTGRYALQLGSDFLGIANIHPQVIKDNIFWLNVAQEQAASYTVLANATTLHFLHNVLRNPSNTFEFSAHSSVPQPSFLNCSENWWGTGLLHEVTAKIRSSANTVGLPDILILPIWHIPPPRFGVTVSCAVGWRRQRTRCWLYRGGAVIYSDAIKTCQSFGASLLGSDIVQDSRDFIYSETQYRDVDSSLKHALIWIRSDTASLQNIGFDQHDMGRSQSCVFYSATNRTFHKSNCNLLRPYICEKRSVVLCKNSCFHNGFCSGTTCICNKGWQLDDCSSFHCRDVGNCFGRGECVGPNLCDCKAGWYGRGCTTSYCSRFDNCHACTKRTGCGWCDVTLSCIPGSGHGADSIACDAWFYYNCLSVGSNTQCSNQIFSLNCGGLHCNTSIAESNKGSCQDCQDAERCYKQLAPSNNRVCPVWDENICPDGVVLPNYDNPSRLDNVVFGENVIIADPLDTLIYSCQVMIDDSINTEMYITTERRNWKPGQILTSAQAGGIFIKIEKVTFLDSNLMIILGIPATITDAIKQADFREQDVPVKIIDDVLTLDDAPPDSLLSEYFNNALNISETITVHTLPDVGVVKCVGHEYRDSSGSTDISQYVLFPASSNTGRFAIGDVIFSDYSEGFLEVINKIKVTSDGTFVFTQLAQCSRESLPNIQTNQTFPDMTAYGGDNWPGILYYNESDAFTAEIGEAVVGRRAYGIAGRIIDAFDNNGFVFLEVIPLETFADGEVVTLVDVTSLDRIQRQKRATVALSTSDSRTLSKSIGGYTATATVAFSLSLKLTLKISWNIFGSTLEEAGWSLDGSIEGTLQAKYTSETSFSKSGDLGSTKSRNLGRFFITIIPGTISFDASASYSISASAKASFTATQTVQAQLTAQSSYRRKSGVTSPSSRVTSSDSSNVEARIEEAKVSAGVTVTPRVSVTWPAGASINTGGSRKKNRDSLRDGIPDALKQRIEYGPISGDFAELDQLTSLRVSFSLPMSVSASGSGCDASCNDANKLTKLEICGKIDAFEVAFAALAWQYQVSLKVDVGPCKSSCEDNLVPCCLCENDDRNLVPGKLDPYTDICMCPCMCDRDEGTVISVKAPEGECLCEFCPDGTLEKRREEPKCPCKCPGKEETFEMKEEGSCPCECECPDGSKETLDEDGNCPCKCICKNCQQSTVGPEGCKCPDDVCPVCEPGTEPRWVGCSCICSVDPCGYNTACVSSRTGPNCELPRCSSCQNCSGNGVCTTSRTSCDSWCQCNARWEGSCCEQPLPNRIFGDPHIETLDGLAFDYFGIGQFWNCLSQSNDFGLQARFFYFGQTSFTGAIAVKAGDSVVTITTPKNAQEGSLPTLKIDGSILNIATEWTENFGNGSVKINVSPNTNESDNMGVVIISLQFKSGSGISFDIRFSPKISRQYINIQYILTKDFLRKTSGICGFMDDNSANDLIGPSGEQFNDTSEFVESWRIRPMVRFGGGLAGSWSWTESNFHEDDELDISYTNPNFVPSYSLEGFNQLQIYAATMLCSSQGLTGSLLDGCIYDIVITDDESFFNQEVLQIGCSNQCSGKGRCINSVCHCISGWSGVDCSVGECGICYFGMCNSGFCQCEMGWEGVDCSVKAECHSVNNCTNLEHGICRITDECLCNDGYIGDDCSVVPTCINQGNCSDLGICVDYDTCKCFTGYSGPSCQEYNCEILDTCSNHGLCVNYDVCLCDRGWSGLNCGVPDCQKVNFCSGFGTCVEPNVCLCNEGFEGANCSVITECPELSNCNERGICVPVQVTEDRNLTTEIASCRCDFGYSGLNCSDAMCDMSSNCSGHGQCVEPNVCLCDRGYTGLDCSLFSCDTLNQCSGHGDCIAFDECSCNDGWSGESCEIVLCDDVSQCSLQGYCVLPNVCHCYDGFQGILCNGTLSKNVNPPMFNQSTINIKITEYTARGTVLLMVTAYDSDDGKNGEVRYAIDLASSEFDLSSHLVIDNIDGTVTLIKPIARGLVPSGDLLFQLIATDQGIPVLSDTIEVNITITDMNNHCPTFTYPPSGTEIFLNSSVLVNTTVVTFQAQDGDFGINQEIEYFISGSEFSAESYFSVNAKGELKIERSPLPVRKHILFVVATDRAETPCSSQINYYVTVYPSSSDINIGNIISTGTSPITTSITENATTTRTTETTRQNTVMEGSAESTEDSITDSKATQTTMTPTTEQSSPGVIHHSATDGDVTSTPSSVGTVVPGSTKKPTDDSIMDYIPTIVLGALVLLTFCIIVVLAFQLYRARKRVKYLSATPQEA